jgi:hypothetical protein
VRLFITACDSASITSIVSEWRPSSFGMLFMLKIRRWKRKCETLRCRDATASSFVVKVRDKVFTHFHAVAVKRHSSMRNWLFGLLGRILCKLSSWC